MSNRAAPSGLSLRPEPVRKLLEKRAQNSVLGTRPMEATRGSRAGNVASGRSLGHQVDRLLVVDEKGLFARFWCDSGAILVRFGCDSGAILVRIGCETGTTLARDCRNAGARRARYLLVVFLTIAWPSSRKDDRPLTDP